MDRPIVRAPTIVGSGAQGAHDLGQRRFPGTHVVQVHASRSVNRGVADTGSYSLELTAGPPEADDLRQR